MIRQGLTVLSTMVLNHCAAPFGDAAIAAMSIVSRINFFMFALGLGIGQGFQPVAGYNYGAQNFKRVRKAFRFTLLLIQGMLGAIAIVGLLLSPIVVGWFRDDPAVIAIGSNALRYQCIALFFQPLVIVGTMLFQTSGHRALASITSLFRNGLFFIPIVWILSSLTGIWGIESSQAITDVITSFTMLPLLIRFFRKLPHDDVSADGHLEPLANLNDQLIAD
jgi:Na+-driven multidrug efflux pump